MRVSRSVSSHTVKLDVATLRSYPPALDHTVKRTGSYPEAGWDTMASGFAHPDRPRVATAMRRSTPVRLHTQEHPGVGPAPPPGCSGGRPAHCPALRPYYTRAQEHHGEK